MKIEGQLAAENEREQQRLEALQKYSILDSLPERGYEDVTELAALICGTPISLVSLVDKDRQWFKSEFGLGVKETPRSQSFCAHTLADAQTLIVEDALADARFKDNPLVLGDPKMRFYAGAPIVDHDGLVLGTVCVIDTEPRVLAERQISALEALARQVMSLIKHRKTIARLEDTITDTKAEEVLHRESERHLQTLVDSFPLLAWMANADGWITWYNRRWYEYTGTTQEAMIGWGWQSMHDPKLLPLVMDRWSRAIEQEEPFEMVFPLRGADGSMRSFLTRVAPVRNGQGELVQWFGMNIQIDEMEKTRITLEASEEGLNQVLNATSDAVMSVDREWVVRYLNPKAEKLYGAAVDLVGRNLWKAFPETVYDGSRFVDFYERAMHQSVAGGFEAEYGEPLSYALGVEVYPSKHGIVIFSRDITQIKHATAAVLQNEKLAAVGRLASSIAHEINNPLESVTNLLYLARRTPETDALDGYLESAERELRRVSAITSQTLRFYKQSTRPLPVSCADLFSDTLQLYQGRLLNSNILVEKRKRASRPATCYAGEIRQVLSNLVGNAIDAMHPRGGRLLLRSREATHWKTGERGLALTVADPGPGMPPHVRRRIFEAFFSTKGIGGTGLGLWVSKEIVDRHKGSLTVRSSEGPNAHGTVFTLFLPFESPEMLAKARSGAFSM